MSALRRADSYPDARSSAILGGRSPAETPNYRLAAELRSINARISKLTTEQQREIQSDWLASWDELQPQLDGVKDDTEARFSVIDSWARHWTKRLSFSYGASPSFTYQSKSKEQRST